ncbi:ATPase family protein [Acidipropionibacterium acidipropionici ATCC 4875]|uniref:ATPase family protein n=1 Tax=Acidipropionibacterium acidipropionici (strain ATCC 4875 / DSM 20272 / JCM 6432 / NBRC 12425 / NCIMB 8070 / 4) TaxID=1171373 RepID=K7S056_ACIA4|nr:AAA family ATPase [Acidipropionibacterium acidipropionici]AFV87912.1 ATPase family protein [Acidipropionibacterium acidipropionici ATCC 4875]ALN14698.1 AAA family ATPase [Acidipropionibacterium acidipropionici]APZ09547.1 AAA family ATPase [Acidipropionibacterium acidipropionici]
MTDERPPITTAELERARELTGRISDAVASKLVGQESLRRSLLVTLLAGGHILLESVPGLAKTLAASTLASAVDGSFARVQCTPDLLPSDIIGTQVYSPQTGAFSTQLGPVHVNFVLLDEINRSSAKTQSAMLEAMQERQTSIGGKTYPLPDPFMVMATQNPIEEEGTYVLPQAQMDRFLLKEVMTYPTPAEELEVVNRIESGVLDEHAGLAVDRSTTLDDVGQLQRLARRVRVDESIKKYIIDIVNVTRDPGTYLGTDQARYIEYGASPRAVISFLLAARAAALLAGRDHVVPEDVKDFRHSVLRHRMILTFEAVAERVRAEDLIDAVFDVVTAP